MKSATIKKLMVNLKPDDKPGDRLIYDGVESVPLKERGTFFRESLLLGALFRKSHPEVLKIAALVASMHDDPTIETVLNTYASMNGGKGIAFDGGSASAPTGKGAKVQEASPATETAAKNLKGIM
ncbi:plasmid partitioning/stability family protein [Erwinia amylovora]|uniref:plasmid partitioning/stability family protein n=1 Tax=Erwinia amylovora TaxID=552 RepID=UPI0020BF4BD8|nr:plasmid partitioning/stability family protein [Erwinia amylovora]MCK8417634.1 plasmid partitioning/stability family protein [Erwinia amylovora]